MAFKLLCDQVEIPCIVVIGMTKAGRHAWNMVRIGGKFYQVDCTWLLRSEIDQSAPFARYRYFNVPDWVFAGVRTPEMDYLPKCTHLRANPFYNMDMCANNLQHLAEVLRRQAGAGEKRVAAMCVGFRPTGEDVKAIFDNDPFLRLHGWTWWLDEERIFIGAERR